VIEEEQDDKDEEDKEVEMVAPVAAALISKQLEQDAE
jgi:hypothetical protein